MLAWTSLMPMEYPSHTVCVPYIRGMIRDQTASAVLDQVPSAVFAEIPADSPTSYAALLLHLWELPGDVVIVEQDVVPPPGSIGELLACASGWCTHGMLHGTVIHTDLLGLAKFGHNLKTFCPRFMECALLGGGGSYTWPNWRSLDRLISRQFRHWDYDPCVHAPDAVHLKFSKLEAQTVGAGRTQAAGALSNREDQS